MLIVLLDMLGYDAKILEGESLTFTKAMEILRGQDGALANLQEHHFSAIMEILANNSHLAIDFTPGQFCGDILFFTATLDQPEDAPTPDAWRPYVDGTIQIHDIACRHNRMMQPGSLAQIGPVLAVYLQEIMSNISLPSPGSAKS
jgi:thioesterase domain-containing protein